MESWVWAWRQGFAPQLSVEALTALRDALERDDPRLAQSKTTCPPPLNCCRDWPCEEACPVAYAGWIQGNLQTVEEVEEAFGHLCHEADLQLGNPADCRHFLQWVDATPRDEMRRCLLVEVEAALAARELVKGGTA